MSRLVLVASVLIACIFLIFTNSVRGDDCLSAEGIRDLLELASGFIRSFNITDYNITADAINLTVPILINGQAWIHSFELYGIGDFNITAVDLKTDAKNCTIIDNLNVTLLFNGLDARIGYELDSVLLDIFPLYGRGVLGLVSKFGIKIGYPTTGDIPISLNLVRLDDIKFKINGLLNDAGFSNIVEQVVNAILPFLKQILFPNGLQDNIQLPSYIQDVIKPKLSELNLYSNKI